MIDFGLILAVPQYEIGFVNPYRVIMFFTTYLKFEVIEKIIVILLDAHPLKATILCVNFNFIRQTIIYKMKILHASKFIWTVQIYLYFDI